MFFHTHIITGPIHSRRLGSSLGINLSPVTQKVCNYDCVYCECGWNPEVNPDTEPIPTCKEVEDGLRTALQQLKEKGERPDSVTFSGNGEPTLHPDFPQVIKATVACVNEFYPENPPLVTVISNATQIGRPEIREALGLCTKVLLKLDAGTPAMYARINRYQTGFRFRRIDIKQTPEEFYPELVQNLINYPHPFTLQTLLFRGTDDNGNAVDNTQGQEWERYVEKVKLINPPAVMLYGLDRETPAKKLVKLSREELEDRAAVLRRAGISGVQAFY